MTLRWLLRILFVSFATVFALMAYDTVLIGTEEWNGEIALIYATIAAVTAAGIVFFEAHFQRNLAREIVAIAFGLAAGLFVTGLTLAIAIAFVLPSTGGDLIVAFRQIQMWVPLIMTALCYIAVTVVLQTKGDFRFLVPYIDFSKRGEQEGGFLLDTSTIIDGRIVDVCETDLIACTLLIPDFVIQELQCIADCTDPLKRKRGRRGLDVVSSLQRSNKVHVQVFESEVPESCDVDLELVRLAARNNCRIMTNDYNLNKVAQIEGIRVINLNDLCNALKPVVIPGERLEVKVIRKGEEAGQGVGYLEDGTMVVIESAGEKIDETIVITITGSIQTSAGKMVFGRFDSAGTSSRIKVRNKKE